MTMTTQQAVDEAGRKARRYNAAEVVAMLDKESRDRALTEAESRRLANALSRCGRQNDRKRFYWSAEMDAQMVEMRRRKVKFADIAKALGVTLKAAEVRAWRLKKSGAVNGN